jgi:von Willebrand factor type A domain
MTFLSPLGALVALAAFAPLAAFAFADRRRRRVEAALALPGAQEDRGRRRTVVLALVSIAALLGLAATQPTVLRKQGRKVRSDAAAIFVIDTSRSMLASEGPTSPTRFERAQKLALELRAKLSDVRVGIASMTDRVLPHLFPSSDQQAFSSVLERSVGIERPPPTDSFNTVVTTLGALTKVTTDNFFPAEARHRLLVVFTDGESRPFVDASVGALFHRPPVVRPIYVQVWRQGEAVYQSGKPDVAYHLDPNSRATIQRLAEATDGISIRGEHVDAAADAAHELLGSGPKVADIRERRRLDLAPYLALCVFAPLGFLLYRRNV